MRIADPHSPTREKILDAAEKLMLRKGFTATSVEEICSAAATTKGSFFHFFGGKDDLGKAALERFFARQMGKLEPAQGEEDPLDRFLAGIDLMAAGFKKPDAPKSCLLGNFSQELAPTHPAIRSACADFFARLTARMARDLEEARVQRGLGREIDPKSLADLLVAVLQGSHLLIKAQGDTSIGVRNLQHFRKYIVQLFGRTKDERKKRHGKS